MVYTNIGIDKPAQITFTLDYHELVTGDIKANTIVRISYDPLRIVPQDGTYIHGDPSQPILAHVAYGENNTVETKELRSPSGIVLNPDIDVTGQGSMLTQEFCIPDGSDELIVWFSYYDPDTRNTYYDDDRGQKFHFRWSYYDVWIRCAAVTTEETHSLFTLEVGAIPNISAISVRWHLVNSEELLKEEASLTETGRVEASGDKIWSVQQVIPLNAILRYKLFYVIEGRRYKNDNASQYFYAPEPQRLKVPPAPKAPVRS